MNSLYEWANRHGVSWEAVKDLQHSIGTMPTTVTNLAEGAPTTEAGATQRVRLDMAKEGAVLFRNNVGAMQDDSGRIVRYGLANESSQMNRNIKSSDLIGLRPVVITDDMVGQTIGQFVAIEMKAPGWEFKGDDHECAQRKFLELVISKGGFAKFSTGC